MLSGATIAAVPGTTGAVIGDNNVTNQASNPVTPSLGSGLTVTGNGTTANLGSDNAIVLNGVGTTVNANGSGNLITDTGGKINLASGAINESLYGNGLTVSAAANDSAGLFGTNDNATGASGTVFNLGSGTTNESFYGNGLTIGASATSTLGLLGSGDNVTGAKGTFINLVDGTKNESFSGNGLTIGATATSTLGLLGSGDTVTGANGTFINLSTGATGETLNGAGLSVGGATGDSATLTGSGDNVSATGTTVTLGSGATSVNVGGQSDTISAATGDTVNVGANSSATITGGVDTVNLTGSGTTVTASGDTVNLTAAGTTDTITGSGNTINASADNETITASNDTLNIGATDTSTTINGSGDTTYTTAPFATDFVNFQNGSNDKAYWNNATSSNYFTENYGTGTSGVTDDYQSWSAANGGGSLYATATDFTSGAYNIDYTAADFAPAQNISNEIVAFDSSGHATTDNFTLSGADQGQSLDVTYDYSGSTLTGYSENYLSSTGSSLDYANFDGSGNETSYTDYSLSNSYGSDGLGDGGGYSPPPVDGATSGLSGGTSGKGPPQFLGHTGKGNVLAKAHKHGAAAASKTATVFALAPTLVPTSASTPAQSRSAGVISPLAQTAQLVQAMAAFGATSGSLDRPTFHTEGFRDLSTFAHTHGMRMGFA